MVHAGQGRQAIQGKLAVPVHAAARLLPDRGAVAPVSLWPGLRVKFAGGAVAKPDGLHASCAVCARWWQATKRASHGLDFDGSRSFKWDGSRRHKYIQSKKEKQTLTLQAAGRSLLRPVGPVGCDMIGGMVIGAWQTPMEPPGRPLPVNPGASAVSAPPSAMFQYPWPNVSGLTQAQMQPQVFHHQVQHQVHHAHMAQYGAPMASGAWQAPQAVPVTSAGQADSVRSGAISGSPAGGDDVFKTSAPAPMAAVAAPATTEG